MMLVPSGVRVHNALGVTDLRKGLDGLAMLIQEVLKPDPFPGHQVNRSVRVLIQGIARSKLCSIGPEPGAPAFCSRGHGPAGRMLAARIGRAPRYET